MILLLQILLQNLIITVAITKTLVIGKTTLAITEICLGRVVFWGIIWGWTLPEHDFARTWISPAGNNPGGDGKLADLTVPDMTVPEQISV